MKIENKIFDWHHIDLAEVRRSAAIKGRGKATLSINGQQLKFLELLHSGMSIGEASNHHFGKNLQLSFIKIREMLEFIAAQDLVTDEAFKAYFVHNWEEQKGLFDSLSERVFGPAPEIVKVKDEVRALPFFRSLPTEQVNMFFKHAKVIETPAKIVVCQIGQTQRSLFVLLRGKVAVYSPDDLGKMRKIVTLNEGSVFGEVGFFLGEPRTANVITEENSLILKISFHPDLYDGVTAKNSAEELQQRCRVIHALLKSEMFRDVPRDCFDALMRSGERKRFSMRTRICREGENGESCYLIVQGEAEVFKGGKSVRKLGQGDYFGEVALLLNRGVRSASVTCTSEVLALEITVDNFHKLLAENLQLACVFECMAIERFSGDRARASA